MRTTPESQSMPSAEISDKIGNYLKQFPDQTPHVANVPKEQLASSTDWKSTLKSQLVASLPGFLNACDGYRQDYPLVKTILDEPTQLELGVRKHLKRNEKGKLTSEMLIFAMYRKGIEPEKEKHAAEAAIAMSLMNNVDASDEHTEINKDEEQNYLQQEKNVFKIRHREVAPRLRGQRVGTEMLHAAEGFVQGYADHFQNEKSIIATTAQLDVIRFFLENGFEVLPQDQSKMDAILAFIEHEQNGTDDPPALRRSVSNYILPKEVRDEEFVIDPQHPFGTGVNVDLSRDSMDRVGTAVTLIKKIKPLIRPLEKETQAGIDATRDALKQAYPGQP